MYKHTFCLTKIKAFRNFVNPMMWLINHVVDVERRFSNMEFWEHLEAMQLSGSTFLD